LADVFPNSLHVREIGLVEATDTEIWNYAKANDFVIVSKDTDFQQRSLLLGHPPKVVWIRVGNCPVKTIFTINSIEKQLVAASSSLKLMTCFT